MSQLYIWEVTIPASPVPCPILTVASCPAYRFLRRQVRWSGISVSWRIFHSLLWSTQSKALAQSMKQMFFWYSFAFSVIQRMLAIWFLVPLTLLNPDWTSGSSQFTYCWSLTQRILNTTLLVHEVKWSEVSCLRLFSTPWTVAYQDPQSMGFSRQEFWSGLPFPSPGDLPNPGNKTVSPQLAGRFFTTEPPEKRLGRFISRYFILYDEIVNVIVSEKKNK